jgi:single-strand DNA-binding protein
MLSSYITVVGNVASEPRVEATDGIIRCFFRVASSERRQDKETKEWVDHATTFYSVTVWRDMAEHTIKTLRKGDRVVLAGKVRSRDFTRQDGTTGTALEVDVDAIGPDLRWRAATIDRTERQKAATETGGEQSVDADGSAPVAADPWSGGVPSFNSATGEITDEEVERLDSATTAA